MRSPGPGLDVTADRKLTIVVFVLGFWNVLVFIGDRA